MRKWNDPVSAELGMLIILGFALVGFVVGLIPGNTIALALIALSFAGMVMFVNRDRRQECDIEIVLTLGLFACFATSLFVTGVRIFVTTPGAMLALFWLYALVAIGYLTSRCCLGWHVGAAVAVLTSFVAVGLWIQSCYSGGLAWAVLLIVAFGLWWGADSWRRANGLAINE